MGLFLCLDFVGLAGGFVVGACVGGYELCARPINGYFLVCSFLGFSIASFLGFDWLPEIVTILFFVIPSNSLFNNKLSVSDARSGQGLGSKVAEPV